MNSKKFWQRGPMSKMLEKPGKAFQKTFRVVRGRKSDFEALERDLPGQFSRLESGLEILDRDFPIREGESRIDYLLGNPTRELTFVWLQRRCSAESLAKLLPDYHWIQKNHVLWPHLFPRLLESRSLRMRVWVFALEVDADLQFLLAYLQGVRIQVFRACGAGETWRFQPWKPEREVPSAPLLPSSPNLLSWAETAPSQATIRVEKPLLTQEELHDLLGVTLDAAPRFSEDETTDPHYQLPAD